MNANQTCPDADTLKAMLEGGLPPESEAALQAHLEACEDCQRRLATLVDSDEAIAQLAAHLRAPLSELSPEIVEAAHRLTPHAPSSQRKADETLTGAAGDTAIPLEFLAEAEDPACIGRLGPYDIRGVIGRGGMGVVLEGYDRKLNRTVAIKVMAPEVAANPVARRRFLREAQAAAAISHDHVVTIHAIDEEHHPPYLVLEFVHGESLQQKIDREGPLELKEILRIGMQAARGLEAAHAQGLVHRDVKPSNILLENGVQRARLTDFGLARAVDDLDVTRTGEVAGTPEYMSPEQAENRPLDPRSDLFSLGSVLYAMCTGRSPFRADNMAAVIRRVCEKSPRPLCEANPDIPPWLAEIIDRLLEKAPHKRFQSAGEVADLLGGYLAHLQGPKQSPTPALLPQQQVPGAEVRRRRWWPFAVASLLLLLAGVLATTEATGVTHLHATVIRLVYGEGTLVIEVDDPDVSVTLDGREVIIRGAGLNEFRLTPGNYRVTASKDGRPVKSELVRISRGGHKVVSLSMEGSVSGAVGEGAADYRAVPEGSVTRVRRLMGHRGQVTGVAFLPDGQQCLSGSGDGTMRLWDVETGKSLRLFDAKSSISQTAISPSGIIAASGHHDGRVFLWNIATGKTINELKGHTAQVHYVEFSRDGKLLLSRSGDKTIRLWDVNRGTELQRLDCDQEVSTAAIFAGDNDHIMVADGTRFALWSLKPVQEVWSAEIGTHPIWNLALSPDARLVALASGAGKIYVVHKEDGSLVATFQPHTLSRMRFTPDGRHLVSGGQDGSLRIWSLETHSEVARLEAQTHCTDRIDVSPDGRFVISGSGNYFDSSTDDTNLHIWQLPESVWTIDYRIAQASQAIEENPADANAWFARAQLYIELSQWEQAADDMRQAVERAADDPLPRLAYPALLIKAGKQEEYRRFCRMLLNEFGKTEDLSDADKVTKICLMQPDEFEVSELPLDAIDRRLAVQDEYNTRINHCTTRALACYRSGDMQGAIRWAREAQTEQEKPEILEMPHLQARWLLVLAMAQHAEANPTEARRAYVEARRLFEQSTPFATTEHSPHWTAGWLMADVLRSEAAEVLDITAEKGAFVVLDSDGAEVGKFDRPAEAVIGSSPGETIEIRGDGPFFTDPIEIPHPLTIRAADGFRPVISNLEPPEAGVSLLLHRAPLVLEGLEFDLVCRPIPTLEGGNVIVGHLASPAALYCSNCTFRKTTDPVRSDVFLHPCIASAAKSVRLVNCQIVIPLGYSIHWNCAPEGRFSLENCLVTGTAFFNSSRPPQPDVSIRLQRNTFSLAEDRFAYLKTDHARSARDDKKLLPRIRFEVLQNVFDTKGSKGSILHFGTNALEEPHTTADALALLSREVAWHGEQNLLPESSTLLEMRVGEQTVEFEPPIDATQWQTLWQASDAEVVTGAVRYQGGDLRAQRLAQQPLSPEDFRLHSGSAGFQAGPHGQDLGADVDLVGPGEAYQRWKQTDEYKEWQTETRELISAAIQESREAFVILDADAQEIRKFDTLAEAVAGSSDGDTIDIRGNGPFLIEPLVIDRALTIKAADGFRPVIEGIASDDQKQLLTAQRPLVMEGLDIHWKHPAHERHEEAVIRAYAPLGMANCRVRGDGQACLWAGQDSVLRNCQFFSGIGWNPPSGGSYRVENCIAGSLCLFPRDVKDASLHLHGNTFLASAALCMIPTEDPQTGLEDPLAKVIRVRSSRNLFSVPTRQLFALQTAHLSESYDAASAGDLLRRMVGWSEQQNLYPNHVPLLALFRGDEERLSGDYRQDFEGWNRFWELEDTGSSEGSVIYAGGNLEAKLKDDPAHVMPEDFRLQSDSAGYRAAPEGKDLGADVDLVGPGEAYERWKQTPDYGAWQEEAQALITKDGPPSNTTEESEKSAASPTTEPEPETAKQ